LDFSKIGAAPEGRASLNEVEREPVFQAVTKEVHSTSTEFVSSKTAVADYGDAPVCMVCSNMLRMTEGCMKCEACGWSKC